MADFKIVSVDPPGNPIPFAEDQAARVFPFANELGASVVDVLRDDAYACSLYRKDAYWEIFQRGAETLERISDPGQWRAKH